MTKRITDIIAVVIELRVRGETALFVLLAADGTVNRMGTGSLFNAEKELSIAQTGKPLFEALRSQFTDEMLCRTGGCDIPDQPGDPCELAISLQFSDGSGDGFGFSYGSESLGPPTEIRRIVEKGVELTEPLYRQHRR